MGNILLKILIAVILVETVVLISINTKKADPKILGDIVTNSPSPVPTQTPTPTPDPTREPTPKPTSTPTQTPTPAPQPTFSSQQINEFIDRFAGQYGVSPHILRYIALCESGFDPSAVKLSYAGLYQYGPLTWKNIRKEMGEDGDPDLRLNAEEAVQTSAYVLHVNKAYIWPNCIPK